MAIAMGIPAANIVEKNEQFTLKGQCDRRVDQPRQAGQI